jgi:TfoX/Sxy family transcriptional regulator of competence genes
MANHSKARTEAEAQFRKTLKATWKGKKVTTPYEAEARIARNKTARLRELRLAKEAAEKEGEGTKAKKGST